MREFGDSELNRRDEADERKDSWSFAFIIPSTTAIFQRSIYGRTRHSGESHVVLARARAELTLGRPSSESYCYLLQHFPANTEEQDSARVHCRR